MTKLLSCSTHRYDFSYLSVKVWLTWVQLYRTHIVPADCESLGWFFYLTSYLSTVNQTPGKTPVGTQQSRTTTLYIATWVTPFCFRSILMVVQWDTYRTLYPLMSMHDPITFANIVRGMIDIQRHEGMQIHSSSGTSANQEWKRMVTRVSRCDY